MGLSLLKGIITGFILSLPFGPVGIYCIELTIVEGRWKGYITAMGMVTIDILYSLVSLLFIAKVEEKIIKYEHFLSILIGLFLMAVAIRKILSKIELKEVNIEVQNMVQNYLTGVAFALVNISSILVITVIFTTLKVYNDHNTSQTPQILLGVLLGGSSLWFTTTNIVANFRKKLNKEKMIRLIKGVNFLLLAFSFAIVVKSLIKFMRF